MKLLSKSAKKAIEVLRERCAFSENGCWIFMGAKSQSGYGVLSFNGRMWLAHRLAFFSEHKGIPTTFLVRHTCDVRACCNPAHLLHGTQLDNMRDCTERGRRGERNRAASPVRRGGREVLRILSEGETSASVLKRKTGVTMAGISGVVSRLRRCGFISSDRDSADGRRFIIKITPLGLRALRAHNFNITDDPMREVINLVGNP